jgi:hypothetical protein
MNPCNIPGHLLAWTITGTLTAVFLFGWAGGMRSGYWAGRRAERTLAASVPTVGSYRTDVR